MVRFCLGPMLIVAVLAAEEPGALFKSGSD